MVPDDRIMAVALESFARSGYDGVSLRHLNKRLGVSPAMLGKRFGGKEQLWQASVLAASRRHRASMAAILDEDRATGARIDPVESLARAFVISAAQNPELHRIIVQEGDHDTPRLHFLLDTVIRPVMEEIVDPVLVPLIQAGRMRPVSRRELFFLVANGAASVCALAALNKAFDSVDGAFDLEEYASTVARALASSVRTS